VSARLLIVDDDAALRQFVGTTLKLEGHHVSFAEDGQGLVECVAQEKPHLVILDVVMPGRSGLEALRDLRAAGKSVPVILLTARDEDADKFAGFEAGADDYLVKPFNSRELIYRVAAVLRRAQPETMPTDGATLAVGSLRLIPSQHAASIGDRQVHLTRTEYALLLTLARAAGRLFTPADLLTRVWGQEYRDQPEILRTNIYRLRHKLEDNPRQPKYLKTRPGVGYYLSP
jgi:DNA-binding response OmpR family regulator